MPTIHIDFEEAVYIVAQYLESQNWFLVNIYSLTQEIWDDIIESPTVTTLPRQTFTTQIPYAYLAHIYHFCSQPNHNQHQQAWQELTHWAHKVAKKICASESPDIQEEIAQLALIKLTRSCQKQSLNYPRTFYAYINRTIRNQFIDFRDKQDRKTGQDVSIVDIVSNTEEKSDWETIPEINHQQASSTEQIIMEDEKDKQIIQFFANTLPTELQRQILTEYFINNLSPQQIAQKLNKKPVEIRLAKARAVKRLRQLPQEKKHELLDILNMGRES
ncbi:MAG TPA: sigma-70 family RNA polymerase sigma factor [Anaerolineae bacterium]|nr:sigma-70 family RNA polymerase sigma factor [Anaerolineae bacterium]